MKTRLLYTKIHEDDYFRSLSDREQNFFIFLLTNEKVNLCGMYHCPDWYILSMKPTWNQKSLDIMKQKFTQNGKFIFLNGWIRIVNYGKYNTFTGKLNEKACNRELLMVPEELKEYPIDTLYIPYLDYENSPSNINNNINQTTSKPEKSEKKKPTSSKATPLTEEDLQSLAEELKLPYKKIAYLYQKVLNYEPNRKSGPYRDYKAAVRTFLDNEKERRVEKGEEFI